MYLVYFEWGFAFSDGILEFGGCMVDWSGHRQSLVPVMFMGSSSSISMGPLEDVGKWHDIKYHVSICPFLLGNWCLF